MLERLFAGVVGYIIRGAATQMLIDILKAIVVVLEQRQDNEVDEEVKKVIETKAKKKGE
ncbi:hypothetical protein VmeM32_00249 [Vibrio phage vB_VmeM-32]|nr:hypothetical protein VmeM32_00249 [Vibrio phage vB_VmeM-32]